MLEVRFRSPSRGPEVYVFRIIGSVEEWRAAATAEMNMEMRKKEKEI